MIHKHIGGKKNQRSVKNSLDYLLRTKNQKNKNLLKFYLKQTDLILKISTNT
jgi:hypothetical protein